jgi:hypothetical protein
MLSSNRLCNHRNNYAIIEVSNQTKQRDETTDQQKKGAVILHGLADPHTVPNSEGPKISVLYANNSTMTSTATDALALTKLPPAARECYKFPNESIATPLMSVRKLDKANLRTTFENDQVTVTNKKRRSYPTWTS